MGLECSSSKVCEVYFCAKFLMMKRLSFVLLFLLPLVSVGQDVNLQLNNRGYEYLERLELKSGSLLNPVHLSMKPVLRSHAAEFLLGLDRESLAPIDSNYLEYLYHELAFQFPGQLDNSKLPILQRFYRDKANFFTVHTENFELAVNPVLQLEYGRNLELDENLFRNTRGVEVKGTIDGKVGFYSQVTENQFFLPQYMDRWVDSIGTVPGAGFVKPFKQNGYDFFNARGYVNFNATRHIAVQLGHGRHFIGNGMRSLLLSDWADDFAYLRLNTQVWRISYQNVFTALTNRQRFTTEPYPRKYGAFHYLSMDVAKWLNVGLFEGVIFHDNLDNGRSFDLNYLNPIIFYRAVEHDLGSPDNAVAGANLYVLPVKNVALYGQLMLDEFLLGALIGRTDSSGWWGNKYGIQAGVKWVDAFTVPGLDYQGEFNTVRPYTYSYLDPSQSYTHFNQPLAHPLGANFREMLQSLTWRPLPAWQAKFTYTWAQYGEDSVGTNFGKDILQSYLDRWGDYGHTTGQGLETQLHHINLLLTWMPRHNVFLDLQLGYRSEESEMDAYDATSPYATVGFRWNVPETRLGL